VGRPKNKVRSVFFAVRLPEHIADTIRESAEAAGVRTGQFLTEIFEAAHGGEEKDYLQPLRDILDKILERYGEEARPGIARFHVDRAVERWREELRSMDEFAKAVREGEPWAKEIIEARTKK
jgi:hypothetical protein